MTAPVSPFITTVLDDKSTILFDPNFLAADEADALLAELLPIPWRQSFVTARNGNTYELPRLQYWMSDPDVKASLYQKGPAGAWTPSMAALKARLEKACNCTIDYVLMNFYRDGKDCIGFHHDDEAEDPAKQTIASISLGAERNFIVKHRKNKKLKYDFMLNHGSLIVMAGETQLHWLHSVPADSNLTKPRINLTFRKS